MMRHNSQGAGNGNNTYQVVRLVGAASLTGFGAFGTSSAFDASLFWGFSVFHPLLMHHSFVAVGISSAFTLHTTYAAWGSEFVDPSSHAMQEHCK